VRARIFSVLTLFLGLSLGLGAFSTPAAADAFTVRGVLVDETADTQVMARNNAIGAGQLLAARQLIERLTLPEDRFAAPPLDAARAARLVSGFQVEEERLGAGRYIARLTVSFDPEAVRNLLEAYGVPFVQSHARPAVVIPLWVQGDEVLLWEANPWLEAWRVAGTSDELVPVIAPTGDLGDFAAIEATQANALNMAALRQIANRYGAERVLVAWAAPASDGLASARMIEINFSRGGERINHGALGVASLGELVRNAAASLQEDWKRRVMVREPYLSDMTVSVLFNSANEWMRLQSVLGGEPLVQDARLDALMADGALMTLKFRGRQDQLALVLREHGAWLSQTTRGGWIITGSEVSGSTVRQLPRAEPQAAPQVAPQAPAQAPGR